MNCHKTYRYNITITFTGIETATNKQGNFSTNLTVQVKDFLSVDDNEPKCDLYKLIATCDTTTLDADVALWEDANGDGSCDIYQVGEDDSVEVTIEAKSYSGNEVVIIEGIIVNYTPSTKNTPTLDSYSITNLYLPIDPGSSIPFPITIISNEQKSALLDGLVRNVGQPIDVESEIYEYSVKISFYGTDITTNKQHNFSINIAVRVSDFTYKETDKETCTWE